jgi:hypothetical protein
MPSYYVAFWNVENLFDVDGSPRPPEWLQSALARELAGWCCPRRSVSSPASSGR